MRRLINKEDGDDVVALEKKKKTLLRPLSTVSISFTIFFLLLCNPALCKNKYFLLVRKIKILEI